MIAVTKSDTTTCGHDERFSGDQKVAYELGNRHYTQLDLCVLAFSSSPATSSFLSSAMEREERTRSGYRGLLQMERQQSLFCGLRCHVLGYLCGII